MRFDCPFALLDDCRAGTDAQRSRLYEDLVHVHRCTDPRSLNEVCSAVGRDLQAGLHAVLLADYEWGAKLLSVPVADAAAQRDAALTVMVFARQRLLARAEVDAWLQQQAGEAPAGLLEQRPTVTRAEHAQAVKRIHQLIAAGETYQVNYTYRLHAQAYGPPVALYRRLRARQPVEFGALIRLPTGSAQDWVLSLSPELFARNDGGALQAKPMKGTAPRLADPAADAAQPRWLANDAKNRAENLMIVDLIRNDLGRVAVTGSVHVPRLFEVETLPTVYQMTSTVQALLRPGTGLAAVLRALFPCGSITGAPKIQTMKRIAELESTPRGLYTGAIGWLARPSAAQDCPDFCLSVAIRTLTLGTEQQGLHAATLGVGGGIVIDSVADDEYEETLTKLRFTRAFDPGVHLVETMHAQRGAGIRYRAQHQQRLARSAAALGFAFDANAVDAAIDAALPAIVSDGPQRLRLTLQFDGWVEVTVAPLTTLQEPVRVLLARRPLPPDEAALAAHKTSHRAGYERALAAASQAGAFDALFFGDDGHLTEGARSNVFVRLDSRWYTPPAGRGVLPGVMRAALLADPAFGACERPVTRAELLAAREIIVCNALRGALRAEIAGDLPD